MNWKLILQPRILVLTTLWALPGVLYTVLGIYALYQMGWMPLIALTLPVMWLAAWLVAKYWKPKSMRLSAQQQPLLPPDFWTERDKSAIQVVDKFRADVAPIDRMSIADPDRYSHDAQALATELGKHYHADLAGNAAFGKLTLVEVFAVIHLAIEDLEDWILNNIPGSSLATINLMQSLPKRAEQLDTGWKIFYALTAISNPAKLLAYPLWRKSGAVTIQLQQEFVQIFYQRYLRSVGYYLIEMYSGRLRGGSRKYRAQFGRLTMAAHQAGGDISLFDKAETIDTTLAVMGQVKAGKSSLINALMQDIVATTSILPQTRAVQKYTCDLPSSGHTVTLLDTPGYDEANVTRHQQQEIQKAADAADLILLVIAANSAARQSDLDLLRELKQYYEVRPHLQPPKIIAVLTHIDLLRPKLEWSPPYHWRKPKMEKEKSIAAAVDYCREVFGSAITDYACVYTGAVHANDTSVADELIPLIIENLASGKSTAVLKTFYAKLSKDRLAQVAKQLTSLLRTVGQSLAR